MKGYKATEKDMTCRGFKYEIGKTYTYDGNISICNKGFHFCKIPADVFNYYNLTDDTRVFEIEADGVVEDGDKCVCSIITIIREIPRPELYLIINSGRDNTGNTNSGDWNSGDWNSGNRNSGNTNSGNRNSGNTNSGNTNSGNRNSGDWNSGDWNSGDWNSGNTNSGNRNSGDWNSGNRNSGNTNSGDWNSGNRNSGDWNSGNWNSGNRNSGNWNSGNRNSGYLNSIETPIYIFNKITTVNIQDILFPDYFYFDIIGCKYLEYGVDNTVNYYKQAFIDSFNNADKEDVKKTLNLPNFNYKVFEEISGITKKMIEDKLKD